MSEKPPRRNDWETPDWLFDQLHEEFRFTVDASAHHGNNKLERYWGPEDDGLSQDWTTERVWCNPPYGRDVGLWIRKGREAGEAGALVVMLPPVRTETTWWCEDVVHASEIRFIQGRVHFKLDGGVNPHPKGSRPVFSSAVIIFGNGDGPRISGSMQTPYVAKRTQQAALYTDVRPFV